MSGNHLRFEGLEELKADLRRLPADLRDEGGAIVLEEGQGAATDIIAAYPEVTGHLKKGVKVEVFATPWGTTVQVKNVAPHAYIFENGTQVRHTALGLNRGAAPPGRVFVPIVVRRRRRMYERLKDLLRSKGLTVSGNAAA